MSAIEKWEVPKTVSQMRAFLGFINYYSSYIPQYAHTAARLMEKLKVGREAGKKGSKVRITWDEEDQKAFEELREKLCSGLQLQIVNPDKPFILRVDASTFAVGGVLEQLKDDEDKTRIPTVEDVRAGKTMAVAFMSRKLTKGQRKWVTRELETYAIILALTKWESLI